MKRLEITFVDRGLNPDFHVKSVDKIEADDLVSLLSQFIIIVGTIHRRLLEEVGQIPDDDLPF